MAVQIRSIAVLPGLRERLASGAVRGVLGGLAVVLVLPVHAVEFTASGRLMMGGAWRTEDPRPELLYDPNAAQIGLRGLAPGGQNSDDANMNFMRGDMVSRALRGHVDINVSEGAFKALVRVKGWYDFALIRDPRPWGHTINRYQPGAPLSDRGVPRMSRFSGLMVADAYLEHQMKAGQVPLFLRIGQQSLPWGQDSTMPGGISAVNPVDGPALRRPGASPVDVRVPIPAVFARAALRPALDLQAWYQTSFRPNAADPCGVLGAPVDYNVEGCDLVFPGGGALSDRARLQAGWLSVRMPAPGSNDSSQFGAALIWKPHAGAELGLYLARYTNRSALPGLRKSTRNGPALLPFDPDGQNQRFFTEYPGGVRMLALSGAHKRARTKVFGELVYRPNQPVQLPSGDVIPPFLIPTLPALLRAEADAVPPGGLFHAHDRRRTAHFQMGVTHDWGQVGRMGLVTTLELVAKHAFGLPDPRVRRYGRADQFGNGPVNGVCPATALRPELQCSLDGYVSPTAYAYRLRVDARLGQIAPGLTTVASAQLTHDLKGWSYDFLVNQGRKVGNLALRSEYRRRYLAEIVYQPNWGGRYNHHVDRDLLSVALGVKF